MNEQLSIQPAAPLAVERPQPSVAEMLSAAIQGGVTPETVGAVEKLCALYERMEARNAEKEFAAAFARLQKELPVIVAKTVIPNRGKYEKFEDVMQAITPALTANGFSVAFDQKADAARVQVTCTLRHSGGHSAVTSFGVRISGKADSETQADCKASTTAKRNALTQALNIVIRQDCLTEEHDATLDGGPIRQEQADELEFRAKQLNCESGFLEYAGAKKFSEISRSKFSMLDALLTRKERTAK